MKLKKHKRKSHHILIVTSDAVDGKNKQFRFSTWMIYLFAIVISVLIGGTIGYYLYEEQIWRVANSRLLSYQEIITGLENDKKGLESEISSLNNKIEILSETINQKTQSENQLREIVDNMSIPNELPLTGAAYIEEVFEGDPINIFTASQGAVVIAAASGVVSEVSEDAEYGIRVVIDHENGYATIYLNQGNSIVKVGDRVSKGTALYVIDEENTRLGYQIMLDGVLINPMDMLEIKG